jgi:hypothetical protein
VGGIPLKDMLQGTARETPFHNTIRNRDNNLITAVFRVKMWRSVISGKDSSHCAHKLMPCVPGHMRFSIRPYES